MTYLSILGLALDLLGVLMLGIDLVGVQRKLRSDAQDRLTALSEILESTGGLAGFLKHISGDWREYIRDDGGYSALAGSYDHDSAKRSVDEIKDGINGLADNLHMVARMMAATVESDQRTAGRSLRVTYGGLFLIAIGFTLQMLAYL